jgi:hypothetical protein
MDELDFSTAPDTALGDPRTWRIAGFVGAFCVVAIAAAIVLLNQGGTPQRRNVDLALPSSTPTVQLSAAPASPTAPTAGATTTYPVYHRHPKASTSPTATTGHVLRTTGSSLTVVLPPPTYVRSPSPPPTSSATSPPPTGASVSLTEGPRSHACAGSMNRCHVLVVTLTNLYGGQRVECYANNALVPFSSYITASPVSYGCAYSRAGATVWVVVDGIYESNRVVWQ